MKKNPVISKKHVLLALLIAALAAAVYLNWYLSGNSAANVGVTDVMAGSTLGEAVYVNNPSDSSAPVSEDQYFVTVRSDRAAARKESLQILQSIIDNVKSESSAVADASAKTVQIAKDTENENSIETLVKSKGFADCAAVISAGKVSVMVKTSGLLASDTMQIQDIVTSVTGFEAENIKIIEVKNS